MVVLVHSYITTTTNTRSTTCSDSATIKPTLHYIVNHCAPLSSLVCIKLPENKVLDNETLWAWHLMSNLHAALPVNHTVPRELRPFSLSLLSFRLKNRKRSGSNVSQIKHSNFLRQLTLIDGVPSSTCNFNLVTISFSIVIVSQSVIQHSK